jgi:hypothetical protein
VTPLLAGFLFDHKLLSLPLIIGTACYGAGAMWFLVMLRQVPLPEENEELEEPAIAEIAVAPAG